MICDTDSRRLPVWEPVEGNSCVVDFCKQLMDAAGRESCGECIFCREGTRQIYEIIRDITEGHSESGDYELLLEILEQMECESSCEMTKTAAATCTKLLKEWEEEWDKHILRKRCSNLVCRCSYSLYIDPDVCDGCGLCLADCPPGVIAGGTGMIHIVNTESSKNCLLSASACPKDAIKKAGARKPNLPKEPVPVGSFRTHEGGMNQDGSGRRRRRG